PPELKFTVQLLLAAALERAGEKKDLPAVAADVDKLAATMIKSAKDEEATLSATLQMATALLNSPAGPVADVGLEYARKAVKLLNDKTALGRKVIVYKLLVRALESRDKKEEAKKLEPTIEKLDLELDTLFRKENVPFEVKKTSGRKGKS